ncbi:MAG: carboxypeptidase regulatory-like domain-containing protein [Terrimicrobiaceae bacterium]
MNIRPLIRFWFPVILALAGVSGELSAAPLILAQPTGQCSLGGGSVSFQVLATGNPSPAYQWQVKPSVPPDSVFTDVPGATGATLTIPNPSPSVDGNKYRCVVTSGASVQSAAATLKVYPAPFMAPPAVTVSPATVASDSTANITIQITGLPFPGATARIERILDLNGNGVAEIGEPLVQSFLVTDGQAAWFGTGGNKDNSLNELQGGVRNANVPGDDETGVMSMNGNITTHISLPSSPESGRMAGGYLIRISDPTSGMFQPITTSLAVTQPNYGQSVSGQVTSGGAPVPHAIVSAVESGGDFNHVASTVADTSGNYTLNLPVGSYTLMTVKVGHVASMLTAPSFSLSASQTLTGQNPTLTAATCTISGTVRDASSSTPLKGVQLFAQSPDGKVALTFSDSDGNYVLPALPGQWTIHTSQSSLAALGYLDLDDGFRATTTEGDSTALDIPLTAATAMVYGTVRDPLGNPIPGVKVEGGDDPEDADGIYDWTTFTDAEGKYFLGVSGGTQWRIEVNQQPAIAPHVMPRHQWKTTASGNATLLDFSVQAVTAHITGTVTKDGLPLAGIVVAVSSDTSDVELTATTDSSGAFDLGVVADTWWIGLDDDSLIYPSLPPVTIGSGQTVANQNITVLDPTGTITGTVVDPYGNPFTDEDVYAYTDSGTYNEVTVEPGLDGSFSLPVLAGLEWWVGSDGCGDDQTVTPQPDASVTIIQSAITSNSDNQSVPLGGNATFTVAVEAPSPTIQWQRLPSGGDEETGWIDLVDNATYSGANTSSLTVASTTSEMTGDAFRCVVNYLFNGTTPVTNTSEWAELLVVTAHLRGTVTKADQPVAGVQIGAGGQRWIGDNYTDASGNFDIGISGNGYWYISVDSGYAASHNIVGPNLQVPVSNNQDVNNIPILLADATGTINGRIVDADGNPVSETGVWGNASIGGNNYWGYSNTDANGYYRFPVIDGTWYVGVNGPLPFNQQTVTVTDSEVVNFAPAQVVAHAFGTVTKDGNPVAGAFVWASQGPLWASATTGPDGSFDLGLTATGFWSISLENNYANANNLVRRMHWVEVNADISGLDIQIADGTGTISGSVKDANDNPLTNVGVHAFAMIGDIQFYAYTNTDGSGNYSLPTINGTWDVGVLYPGYTTRTVSVTGSAEVNFAPAPAADDHGNSISTATTVGQESTTPGNIETSGDNDFFRIDVTESGTLTVQTASSTDTYGYLLDSSGNELTSDDDNGPGYNFILSYPVSPGTYYVRVRFYSASETGSYQLMSSMGDSAPTVIQGLVMGSGQVGGVSILATQGSESVTTTTNSWGSFDLVVPSAGSWNVTIAHDYANSHNLVRTTHWVEAVSGQTTWMGSIFFANATGTIFGSVWDAVGDPLASTGVHAFTNLYGTEYYAFSLTDASGSYTLPSIDGTWNVSVLSAGYDTQSIVGSGSSQVDFAPAVAHVSGVVTIDGGAAANVPIIASQGAARVRAISDSNGNYQLGVTGAGDWDIDVDPGFAASRKLLAPALLVAVGIGENVMADIPMRNSCGTISGSVRDAADLPLANTGVYGTATIGGESFSAYALSDSNGYYSFPVARGVWTVGVEHAGFSEHAVDVFDSANIFFSLRTVPISATGGGYVFSNFAGAPGSFTGSADGSGSGAAFSSPSGIVTDASGNIYVSDSANNLIRKVTSGGAVTTLVGSFSGSADGTGTAARFSNPQGMDADAGGNLYVAEAGSHRIRKVTPEGGVAAFSGSAGFAGSADGSGVAAFFNQPSDVAVDAAGNVYVADAGNHAIRKISTGGAVTTLAGTMGAKGSLNGSGASAKFQSPQGIAVDAAGNVYVADTANCLIRKITSNGTVSTFAGSAFTGSADRVGRAVFTGSADITGRVGFSGSADFTSAPTSLDGTGASAAFSFPTDIDVDASGNLYVTDSGTGKIRKITSAGVVTTLGGDPDGFFRSPLGITAAAGGNLFVADAGNNRIALGMAALPAITTAGPLPSGAVGVGYNQVFSAAGGLAPYAWTVAAGSLPAGLDLGSNGTISGTPTAATTANFTVQVTDANNVSATAGFTITVTSPFATWQESKFTPEDIATGLTVLTADFDRDGMPNLLEYAFGKNPKIPDTAGIVPNVSAGKMQISFKCDATCTDITYTVQASSNLSTWEDIAESVGGAFTVQKSGSGCAISDSGTGLRTVTVTEATVFTGKRFLRVKVASP